MFFDFICRRDIMLRLKIILYAFWVIWINKMNVNIIFINHTNFY